MCDIRLSRYEASTDGRVRNAKTREQMSLCMRQTGYYNVALTPDDGKSKTYPVHRLIAKVFVPNPENKKTVHHKDSRPGNNHVSNLMWATQKEQCNMKPTEHKCKPRKVPIFRMTLDEKSITKFEDVEDAVKSSGLSKNDLLKACNTKQPLADHKWRFCDKTALEGEILNPVTIPGLEELYLASDYGRVYKVVAKTFTFGSLTSAGYRKMSVRFPDGKTAPMLIHRLVASAFKGHDTRFVNHKDGNKLNNHIDNLEYVSGSQNTQHAVNMGLITNKHRLKEVVQFDLKGNEIKRFESATSASNETKIWRQNIITVCKKKTASAGGFIWKYVQDVGMISEAVERLNKSILRRGDIIRYNLDGKEIARFGGISQIGKELHISVRCVRDVLSGKRPSYGDSIWRYASSPL